MALKRVVLRFPPSEIEALDGLKERYFQETTVRLSRASVARVLMGEALAAAAHRRATEVLPAVAVARTVVRGVVARGRTR
jgi:hypothetical protein